MKSHFKKFAIKVIFTAILSAVFPFVSIAQSITTTPVININAMNLLLPEATTTPVETTSPSPVKTSSSKHVEVSASPRSGSFVEGSTFEVPILLNTKGASINGIEVYVSFDKDKLSIIQQSNGTSIIGVWVEPPQHDNIKGMASYVGVVPNGITTGSGSIGTITFKALSAGQATVSINTNSRVLLNDGLGTKTILDTGRGVYTILPKAPEGVRIYSETHPFQGSWYNNNSPVVSWDRDIGIEAFSFVLDNKPGTIPDNDVNTTDTTASFNNLTDGLWYFHIKAHKDIVWGTTGQFLMRIDTSPPADFKPEVSYLTAAVVLSERTLISFFTTDNLSGVDHYEVGVIDKSQPPTSSPVFVQAESPFQVPLMKNANLRVIVRAIDKAGNIRDASVDVKASKSIFGTFWKDYLVWILLFILLLIILAFITHYLFGHHVLKHLKKAFKNVRQEEREEVEEMMPVKQPLVEVNIPVTTQQESVIPQNQVNIPVELPQPIQIPQQEVIIPAFIPTQPTQSIEQPQQTNIPQVPVQVVET